MREKSPVGHASRDRRGSATIELAVAAPVVFVLIFGSLELGRAMMVQHLLTTAARDGARTAVLEGATAESVANQVSLFLTSSSVAGVEVQVSPNPLTLAQGGDAVTVSVQVPFSSVSWLPAPWFMGGSTLEASISMRREVFTSTSEEEE